MEFTCARFGSKPDGSACDDQNACTADDACTNGTCAGNAAPLDGAACDDQNSCTSNDTCASGTCTGTPAADSTRSEERRVGKEGRARGGTGWDGKAEEG